MAVLELAYNHYHNYYNIHSILESQQESLYIYAKEGVGIVCCCSVAVKVYVYDIFLICTTSTTSFRRETTRLIPYRRPSFTNISEHDFDARVWGFVSLEHCCWCEFKLLIEVGVLGGSVCRFVPRLMVFVKCIHKDSGAHYSGACLLIARTYIEPGLITCISRLYVWLEWKTILYTKRWMSFELPLYECTNAFIWLGTPSARFSLTTWPARQINLSAARCGSFSFIFPSYVSIYTHVFCQSRINHFPRHVADE